jgi:hypothetical protein
MNDTSRNSAQKITKADVRRLSSAFTYPASIGVSPGAVETKPASQIEAQMNDLDARLGWLEKVEEDLTKRLAPVIQALPAPPQSEKAECELLLCPLAERIRHHMHRVEGVARRIEQTLGQIQI